MLLKILSRIPLIQCLTNFSYEAHKVALKKFFTLWVLTSLPIIAAAGLSPIPDGDAEVVVKLFDNLREAIVASELFIYAASFLTPVLYIYYEKQGESQNEGGLTRAVRGPFRGYGFVALASAMTLFLTAVAFSSIKTDAIFFKKTFLSYFLTHTYLSIAIYFFSLYCWYLTMLDGTWNGSFVDINRQSESSVASDFSARLKARGAGNE